MKRIARFTYYVIYGVPLLVLSLILLLAISTGRPTPGATHHAQDVPTFLLWSGLLFFGWLTLGRRVALWLLPLCVSNLTCPGCGEQISAVGRSNCACGFNDHRERHILAGSCPKCGNRTS